MKGAVVTNSGAPRPGPQTRFNREPIAVVGMACRFPGAPDLDSFWQVLDEGRNTVTEGVPGSGKERLGDLLDNPEHQNPACRFGAFVDGIEMFDAAFFRISPVEAQLLDPQQRMMLEVTWQALEDAGIDPDGLKGSLTGVYAGISNDEYRMMVLESTRPTEAAESLYALSGTNLNGAGGRVSFVLGLMGPAKAVDAACASSLVSVHDAVADLQMGKADLAIAGGVQAILNTRIYELRAEAMMLSPDGQCKAFDASANGYVRGEGCGVVVLKRLSEAEADGNRIWAVIRGAAINHGGTGVGLTVPNTPALEQVMAAALSDAEVRPSDIDYLEAHGTGTAVGDPIEINAVANVFGPDRLPDNPLLIGSVKTNIGHLESAAGIAGLIKAVLVVNQGVIPEHLHFRNPNPAIDWDSLPVQVTSTKMDWPDRTEKARLAGVNSFGISGTNAHLVVGEHRDPKVTQQRPMPPPPGSRSRILPLSAKSEDALRESANRYRSWLENRGREEYIEGTASQALLSDLAWTAGVGRSHFDHRAAIVFNDLASLVEGLDDLAEADRLSDPKAATKVAFAYTGQGSQWTGMGRDLYQGEPVAQAILDRCEAVFLEERGTSLLDVMFGHPGASGDLGDTAWEQPALYALECALTELWAEVGIRPAAVLGHSVGELAAAQAAGVFSLEDGMRFAVSRGELLSAIEPGAMAVVFASAGQVESEIEAANTVLDSDDLGVAAYNGAHQVVSGPVAAVDRLVRHFESAGIRTRRLNTTRAFHSVLVEPALDALQTSLDYVSIRSPDLAYISNLTGRPLEPGRTLDGTYWRRHAREPVAFAAGVEALADLEIDLVIEIGPHAVLGPMAKMAWPESDSETPRALQVLSSLQRPPRNGSTPVRRFVDAVAEAYQAGLPVSFKGLFAGETRRRISIPGYPFQRRRHWLVPSRHRRSGNGHPGLGVRHQSAGGEITFETDLFPSDPTWLKDHRVFNRLVAPGALYGAMAASALRAEGSDSIVVEDFQLHNPLVLEEDDTDDRAGNGGCTVQVVLDDGEQSGSRRVRIFSRGATEEWIMHVEGRLPMEGALSDSGERIDLAGLKANLSPADLPAYYRAKSDSGIDLGPAFRTLEKIWSGPGEALGEVSLTQRAGRNEFEVPPLLLDGCFQVVGVARGMDGSPDEATYLPFGWERLWLAGPLPDRFYCHVRMNQAGGAGSGSDAQPEVLSGELRIYDSNGAPIGGLSNYTVKRATPAALLSAVEGVKDLLYEVVWRDCDLESGLQVADFFPTPAEVSAGSPLFPDYLSAAGVDPDGRNALLTDLESWSRSYALHTLEKLGWCRRPGEVIDPDELLERLEVVTEHRRLFRRMLEMAAKSGILEESDEGFLVLLGPDDPRPTDLPAHPEGYAERMAADYPQGLIEVGLFKRSGHALADVLRGQADPLTLLFSSGEPTAADLYLKAPVARAANAMLRDAIRKLLARLPEDRHLRVLEIGAGTGSATASVLPELPSGRFDYTYTDISAGFFAEAEERFGDGDGCIRYLPLDIEKNPISQGFDPHGYDLLIASNVLHATRFLQETLGHCRDLLAPSGQLVALENLRGLGWMDLTFGQLDGWWRFADHYRPHHALATPDVWRRALGDAGFEGVEVLGVDDSFSFEQLDKGVIVAQGPAKVAEPPGVWVLVGDQGGVAEELAAGLTARNQTVVMADRDGPDVNPQAEDHSAVIRTALDLECREAWFSLIEGLPGDIPFSGVVHLAALDGHGNGAATAEMMEDVSRAGASALALIQGLSESGAIPAQGVWFVTSGAQVLEREREGELSSAVLWGLGKVVALEASHLSPRMIDLEPGAASPVPDLLNELMYPDRENHIAYRSGRRKVARLVRADTVAGRIALPETSDWVLAPDSGGVFDRLQIKPLPARSLAPREIRVAVEAAGLNFWDVFRSLGFIEEGDLGREMCGYVTDIGSEVSKVSVGDHVVGLGFGAFAPKMVTHEELVAPAPAGVSVSALATIPSAFVSAALSFQFAGLKAGDRVLVHAAAGGVGVAAIQLAQAVGAEVYATASLPKHNFVRSLGVDHLFDSRTTDFGEQILASTGGTGVDVVLNSLTGEGFIEASLDCLSPEGKFVEMARRDILTEEEMSMLRPDVSYHILELDVLKKTDPERVGRRLKEVMDGLSAGTLSPLIHSRWPLAEAGPALSFMRAARHLGKIVVTNHPLRTDRLREDRTYLVTGGLGGIGIAVADWLTDLGAGVIVLNGRREPDTEAREAIEALRQKGVRIEVEIADVSDTTSLDAMLARMNEQLPPLAGVIHSVGVLSDAAITNQTWESFERVLWPKIVGGWHLHRATEHLDLDLFILFSSRVGVMGNPGQANHAAANAFLDQLAAHRRARGLPGQSIAWGAWSEIGEAAEQRERIEQRRAALGGRWFTPKQGIRALERLVRQDTTNSVVMSMDWSVFERAIEHRPPLLEEMLSSESDDDAEDSTPSDDLLTRLRSGSGGLSEQMLVSFLQQEVQAVLRLPKTPPPTVGFFDLGMDSLMAVELRNRLNRAFAGEYVASNTVVFDYPDIAVLARHMAEELGRSTEDVNDAQAPDWSGPEASPPVAADQDGIAVVGMACRFPGAENLTAFWDLLESGGEAITDGRLDGGSWAGVVGDPEAEDVAYRRGAFLNDIDLFDSRFFSISPIEAQLMDPQQRMLLEISRQAIEDAGLDPAQLIGSRTGVYVGIGTAEYRDLISAGNRADSYLGTTGSVAVGRIAFTLGLQGPALPVDMACASSLAAIHQAVAALQRDEVDAALVGGVNVVLSPAISRFMMDIGMLAPNGQIRPFDAAASGYVRGEGCGMVVLKRLRDAEAAGDRIWAVIRGSAVNQNGAGAGLTVPNGPAQEKVMAEALAQAGVSPLRVDYLEAHATGSQLGDPIELNAAAAVYGEGRDQSNPLIIGTVKSNIGHTEWAAGIAAFIKTVLSMGQGVIPPQLNFDDPNPHVDWDRIPMRIASEKSSWPADSVHPPMAGINAFGLSGTNAHVLVEGYASVAGGGSPRLPTGAPLPVTVSLPEPLVGTSPASWDEPSERARAVRLLPLSGKSPKALRDLADRYLAWLDDHVSSPDLLSDLAWTAGVGRSHFPYRAGLFFDDAGRLRQQLQKQAEGQEGPDQPPDHGPLRVAFTYYGEVGTWIESGLSICRQEPVARAVLARCEELIRQNPEEPWPDTGPPAYALECALTALWGSVGIRPDLVVGHGSGGLAAAWAAGAITLEEGLRVAAALDVVPNARSGQQTKALEVLEATLAQITFAPSSALMINGTNGQAVESLSDFDLHHTNNRTPGQTDNSGWRKTLNRVKVDALVEIGPDPGSITSAANATGPGSLLITSPTDHEDGFIRAVARAYEAGFDINFAGLFAGETRRRISAPLYPFQRRRHWI